MSMPSTAMDPPSNSLRSPRIAIEPPPVRLSESQTRCLISHGGECMTLH